MLFIPGCPTPHSLGIGTNLIDYWVCRMIRIDQTRKGHIKHYHFFLSKIVGAENSSSQEFYKRAAEMFELADHSESNFSKSLVATKGRGSGVYPAKHPRGKVEVIPKSTGVLKVSFMAWGTTCRAGFLNVYQKLWNLTTCKGLASSFQSQIGKLCGIYPETNQSYR